jgi:hypothetical protein
MFGDLLQGKKVGVFAVVTIMSGVAGTIWAGALLWNQIQVNTANVQSIASYNDDEIWKDVEENTLHITELTTKQNQVNFTEIMQKLSTLETKIESMTKDIERNEKTSTSKGNPLSL